MISLRRAASVLALVIAIGGSAPSSAQPEGGGGTGEQPAAEEPVQRDVLTAARDRDGTHVILSSGSDGSFAVHVGPSTNPKPLKVLSVMRVAPNFHVDTLELGEITFNSVAQTVTIPGDVGFVQKNPTRTFTLRPKRIAVRRALGEVPPRVNALRKPGGDPRLDAGDPRQLDAQTRRSGGRPGWVARSRTTASRDTRRDVRSSTSSDPGRPQQRARKVRKGPR